MKSTLFSILAILALCGAFCQSAAGQSIPSNEPVKVSQIRPVTQQMTLKHRIRFDVGDLAMLGGGAWDVAASTGKREAGVTGHGGQFNAGANAGVKLGVYSFIKIIEYYHPQNRKALLVTKLLVGTGWGIAGWYSGRQR